MNLENFSNYLSMCSDDLIWKPFFDDECVLFEFNSLLKKIDESKKWDKKRNHEKGKILEDLVKLIMSRFTILKDISINKSTTDNELDIFLNFNDNVPMPFLCDIKSKIICECKNWKSRKVDVGMVSKLVEVCNKNNAGLGIFISLNGLTGSGWQYAEGKRRKLYLSEKIPIISFTIDELKNLKYEGYNIFTMIKSKRQALIDEMEFDGGHLKSVESESDFLSYLNDNIDSFKNLELITSIEYKNIKTRIESKYSQ